MIRKRIAAAVVLALSVLALTAAAASAEPIEASSVATGRGHTCAVLTSGQAVCWGGNFYGELGNGNNTPSKTPVAVSGLTDAESITANGEYTTCAIRTGGQALCWGKNLSGQIGDGSKTDRNVPTPVSGLTDAESISSGPSHTCAIRSSGQAVCWGSNGHGGLGDNSTTERLTPVNVSGLSDAGNITVGVNHTCAARDTGEALCWGYNVNGVLGIGNVVESDIKVPTAVKGPGGTGTLGDVVELVGGEGHSCARQESGQMYCWGDNFFGRLGDDTVLTKTTPVAVSGMTDAGFISGGYASSCAIRDSGQALCWGSNASGRLGDGTTAERHVPTPVSGLTDAVQMSGKLAHMCAVRSSGQVVCWGDNSSGQLGDGSEADSLTPVVVMAGEPGGGGPSGGNPGGGGGSSTGTGAGTGGPSTGKPSFAPLKANPAAKKVEPGGKVTIQLTVKNSGASEANGVKVCVKAPKGLVSVKACQSVGKLAAGASKKVGFAVTVKKGAESGAKAKLTFTVSGPAGVSTRSFAANITVR